MASILEVADHYVDRLAAIDAVWAGASGITGHEAELTDLSPEGANERRRLDDITLAELATTEPERDADRIARNVMIERLCRRVERDEAGIHLWDLSVSIGSPPQAIRVAFDSMRFENSDDWERVAQRMQLVPSTLEGYVRSLRAGVEDGLPSSRRQAIAVAKQCLSAAGLAGVGTGYFRGLADRYDLSPNPELHLAAMMRKSAVAADQAYADLAVFLTGEYASVADRGNGVGRDFYCLQAAWHLGDSIDPEGVYAWGWDQIVAVESEIRAVCEELLPGARVREVIEYLEADNARWISGADALVGWLQDLLDRTIEELHPHHFDIPEAFRHIDVRIAPPGGPANQYYTPPSEDFSRPGIYWYPTAGQSRFSMWSQVSTAFHEGVPGHHLQNGWARFRAQDLTRYQRVLSVGGHSEGWALYAERLADELGLIDRPEYRLDMLLKSLFRSVRVVVDIGLHLGLRVPVDAPMHAGERWTPELAADMLRSVGGLQETLIASEVDRYLGAPGQAITYKLGEQAWLQARAGSKRASGADFELRRFHERALSLGPMGLSQLSAELR